MAQEPPPLDIHPPLINTACPWATTIDQLKRLYFCPSTGAVTTRTSLLKGFDDNPEKHQYAFFDAGHTGTAQNASLNSLGYSPHTLESYLTMINSISAELSHWHNKWFIVSVTGLPEDIAESYKLVTAAAADVQFPLAIEINLSCPNIPNLPPPAYSQEALTAYLAHLQQAIVDAPPGAKRIPVGVKTPPYTYSTQFDSFIAALEASAPPNGVCPLSFITATNTLGSCFLFQNPPLSPLPLPDKPTSSISDSSTSPTIDSSLSQPLVAQLPDLGLGGMAGSPLHPLSLGNVRILRRLLSERFQTSHPSTSENNKKLSPHLRIIGVGGVADAAGYRRMRAAGADVVGLATGLGVKGVGVFGDIEKGVLDQTLGGGAW
ncbi:hypothetical protein B0J18DRAFT_160125 [Chaetomium sp. MPI-SDFR-AT-0129]|nr:hypothetical protein B0J18DRAFT_160125 [Chaetomium sp. MPI-SDFR-AT-0129]